MSKSTTEFTITADPFVTDDVWISASEFTRTRGDDTYAFVTRNLPAGGYRWQIIHYPNPIFNGSFEVLAEGVSATVDEAKAVSMAWLALHA